MARTFLAGIALGVLFLAGCGKREEAAFEMMQSPPAPKTLPKLWVIPDFALTERSGETLKQADLAGKVWVADFIYTTCPGPCPMLSSRLSEVQTALGDEARARLVSISVDPEKDTPEVLKQYAEKFKASDRWYFLTGTKEAIYSLAKDGFKLPLAGAPTEGGLITHTTRLILVDKLGVVRGLYEGADESGVKDLLRDMRTLLAEK